MTALDVAGLSLAIASVLAMVPYVLTHRWQPAFAVSRRRPRADAWMTGPGAYESFVAGGVRALIDRSPMCYDVAIYSGGGA